MTKITTNPYKQAERENQCHAAQMFQDESTRLAVMSNQPLGSNQPQLHPSALLFLVFSVLCVENMLFFPGFSGPVRQCPPFQRNSHSARLLNIKAPKKWREIRSKGSTPLPKTNGNWKYWRSQKRSKKKQRKTPWDIHAMHQGNTKSTVNGHSLPSRWGAHTQVLGLLVLGIRTRWALTDTSASV